MSDYPNSGALFKNDYKEPGDNKPDYKGNLDVNGEDFEIAAWLKTSNDGTKKFLSLKVSPPYQKQPVAAGSASADDDVPF